MQYIKKIKSFLIGVIVSLLTIRVLLKLYADYSHNTIPFDIVIDMKYDFMAIGALFAIAYHNKDKLLIQCGTSFLIPILFWVFVIAAVFFRIDFFSLFTHDMVSIITGLFIIYLIRQDKKISFFESPVMSFLGQISYGIYVYHRLILASTKWLLVKSNGELNVIIWIITSLSATILIAFLSYRFFETPFLRLKNKFAIVRSSNT